MFSLMPFRRARTERPEEFGLLRREFANLFERAFPMLWEPWEVEPWGMSFEEGESEVIVRAELPGFEPSELNVTVTGNVLTVRAEHRVAGEETPQRTVERTVTLPAGLNTETVAATYRNGVLELHFPRTPETLPHRIEVKV